MVAETHVEINVLPFEDLALFLEGRGEGEEGERKGRVECGFLKYISFATMEHLREMEVYVRA